MKGSLSLAASESRPRVRPRAMPARAKKPRGYVGTQHETIGSDILAVLQVMRSPVALLGATEVDRLASITADAWYPIEDLLGLMDILDADVGHFGLMNMGRRIFELTHRERVLEVASSARDIVQGIDGMYKHANRGRDIGGWRVVNFTAGHAEIEKTTPHHCVMEQGLLNAAFSAVGCPSIVAQSRCLLHGDQVCTFLVSSSIGDARWLGK